MAGTLGSSRTSASEDDLADDEWCPARSGERGAVVLDQRQHAPRWTLPNSGALGLREHLVPPRERKSVRSVASQAIVNEGGGADVRAAGWVLVELVSTR